jgi:tRNA/rRNA methyltransferase
MHIVFILSHPAVPENIGLALRAMKTMGFAEMRLINPPSNYLDECRKTAYGSHDLLESAKVFTTLAAATIDLGLVVGTTAKNRLGHHSYHSPKALCGILKVKSEVAGKIGMVFGSEQNGLSKEEINQCDLLSTIPLATIHPSLNLAQSVLLYAYELSQYSQPQADSAIDLGEDDNQKQLKDKALTLLEELELPRQPSLYFSIRERIMRANSEQTKLMLSFARFLKQKLR